MYYPQIKLLRLKAQYKQEYVAYFLNISQPQYSKLENGVRSPNAFELNKLTDLYKVSTDVILSREVSPVYVTGRRKTVEDLERQLNMLMDKHENLMRTFSEYTSNSQRLMDRLTSLFDKKATRGSEKI